MWVFIPTTNSSGPFYLSLVHQGASAPNIKRLLFFFFFLRSFLSIMSFRPLRRYRLLRKLAILSILTTSFYFFVSQWSEQPYVSRSRVTVAYEQQQQQQQQQPCAAGRIHIEHRNHTNQYHKSGSGSSSSDELDVQVPRDFALESYRRIRSKQQRVVDEPRKEDSVYRLPEDDAFLPPGDGKDPNERYLAFYPHSGFHNQRIALINALLLAERLNRTLLMPPVVLGEPIHWRKYDSLESFHRRMSKANLGYCREYLESDAAGEDVPKACQESFRRTSLRWDRLFDMREVKQRVRVRYRDDYDRTYLQRTYGLTAADTYHVKDDLLYDYRVSDQEDQPLKKYQREIFLWDLAKRPERLISFGSLFGTGRVMCSTEECRELQQFLTRQFVFSHAVLPELFAEADAIIAKLGGPRSYISLHARVGDSIFERFSSQVMGRLIADLEKYKPLLLSSSSPVDNNKEQCLEHPGGSRLAIDWSTYTTPRPLVLFMATDAANPREHPLFQSIYDTFPCVFTLSDFYDYRQSALSRLVNPADGIHYGKFLVPFLDGLIASHGQEFTGSMWSTFSSYIRFLHEQYYPSN